MNDPLKSSDEIDIGRPKRKERPSASEDEISEVIKQDPAVFSLSLTDHVITGVRAHSLTDPDHEVGGILLGRLFESKQKTAVIVTNIWPLPTGSTSAIHFDFDERSLLALHARPRQDTEHVIGWFHSHVNIGDPFMSQHDLKLHRNHFKEPWHISCIVGGGEWALPVGFWRMDGKKLIQIEEYYVQMTRASSIGEQSRRFLSACVDERAFSILGPIAPSIMKDLGIREDSKLISVFGAGGPELKVRSHFWSQGVRLLMSVSELIASDTEAAAEAHRLVQQLKLVRTQEEALAVAGITEAFGSRIAVDEGACYSLTPGRVELCGVNFVFNCYWPLTLMFDAKPTDLAYGSCGDLWVLSATSEIVRVAYPPVLLPGQDPQTIVSEPAKKYALAGLDGDPEQVSVGADHFWVRTNLGVFEYRISTTPELENQFSAVNRHLLRDPNSVVLRGIEGNGSLVSTADGALRIWSRGDVEAETVLPRHWSTWRVKDACIANIGLVLLFDDGGFGQLAMFEPNTLRLLAHYVQHRQETSREMLHSLCVDSRSRVFIRRGDAVYLLKDSGAPPRMWHHYRELSSDVHEFHRA